MALPKNALELEAVGEFRELVNDLNFQDGELMRFLRARNLNLKSAEDMIRKFVIWRREAECNNFLGWRAPSDLLQFDMYLTGFDWEGRPVFWAPYGFWPSVRDLMDRGLLPDILKHCGHTMERVYQLLLLTKHQQFIALVDSEGVTFSKVFYEAKNWRGFTTLMQLVRDYEANFPELLCKAYLFNTPLAFLWGWKFLSPCFNEYTHSKISMYGHSVEAREEWSSALFNNLPSSTIPQKYGGSCCTPMSIMGDLIQAWEQHQTQNASDRLQKMTQK